MTEEILADLYRITGKKEKRLNRKIIKKNYGIKYLYYWRKAKQTKNLLLNFYYKLKLYIESIKLGIEIPLTVELGKGAMFIHPIGITINSKAKIGKNFTILKGATIGNIKTGKKSGAPKIEDDVYIGINSTVVGNIKIGNDVLIAANSFVNFDVPPHSIVIGNPGVIHKKKNATEMYIINPVS